MTTQARDQHHLIRYPGTQVRGLAKTSAVLKVPDLNSSHKIRGINYLSLFASVIFSSVHFATFGPRQHPTNVGGGLQVFVVNGVAEVFVVDGLAEDPTFQLPHHARCSLIFRYFQILCHICVGSTKLSQCQIVKAVTLMQCAE